MSARLAAKKKVKKNNRELRVKRLQAQNPVVQTRGFAAGGTLHVRKAMSGTDLPLLFSDSMATDVNGLRLNQASTSKKCR